MKIENRLKETRVKAGLTQEELATKSGVSRTTIVALERGNKEVVKTDTLVKLADSLNEPITSIFFTV